VKDAVFRLLFVEAVFWKLGYARVNFLDKNKVKRIRAKKLNFY